MSSVADFGIGTGCEKVTSRQRTDAWRSCTTCLSLVGWSTLSRDLGLPGQPITACHIGCACQFATYRVPTVFESLTRGLWISSVWMVSWQLVAQPRHQNRPSSTRNANSLTTYINEGAVRGSYIMLKRAASSSNMYLKHFWKQTPRNSNGFAPENA